MNKYLVAVLLLAVVTVVSACENHSKASQKSGKAEKAAALTQQNTCPVMGGKINKELFVEQEGKRIYVCCAGCIDAVKKDFQKHVAELEKKGQKIETVVKTEEKKTSLSEQKTCPVMEGRAINKKLYVDHNGQRIYVCCGGCIAQVQKDPEKAIKYLQERNEGVERIES